jgi:hypothetical protein
MAAELLLPKRNHIRGARQTLQRVTLGSTGTRNLYDLNASYVISSLQTSYFLLQEAVIS